MKNAGNRTEYDVGAILRQWGPDYSRTHPVSREQRRVMKALAACRTAALGGHLEQCGNCGYERPVYNSCGDRHCPKCLGIKARKWLDTQMEDLLNTVYFHGIFTIPDLFNVLVPYNERTIYNLMFSAATWTLQHFARTELGGELGITATLHTWGQTLWLHPHIHTIVTGGALSFDRTRWKSTGASYLFDVHKLSAAFRDRFCTLLRRASLITKGDAAVYADPAVLESFIAKQQKRDWVVYSQPPVKGPRQILEYVSRYTHRVAISNRRLLNVAADGTVTLSYKDYRRSDSRARPVEGTLQLSASDFIGRFLRHVLPRGFRKVRTYGLLAGPAKAAKLAAVRQILGPVAADPEASSRPVVDPPERDLCPHCGARTMRPVLLLMPCTPAPVILKCVLRLNNSKLA